MSDSFADIWASSAPTKSTVRPPQSKIASSNALPHKQQYDAFSVLSASQPSSRPVVNNQLNNRQGRQTLSTSRGGDAFSGLFASSLDGTATSRNPDQANMTMAERATLAQKAMVAPSMVTSTQTEHDHTPSSLWDGLDTLAIPAMATPRPAVPKAVQFASPGIVAQHDGLGFSDCSSPPPTFQWDFDEPGFTEPETGGLVVGGREGSPKHPEDDVLGDLGKPVSHRGSPSPNPPVSTSDPVRPHRVNASPPPHITGQLVEMGFSPADAHTALVNTMTGNGFDIQAAANLLLSQAGQEASSPHSPEQGHRRNGNTGWGRDHAARSSLPTHIDSVAQPSNPSQTHPPSNPQLDITAERLLSQASEIGRGMFSKANALWKEGKERAVKMYEERALATNATNGPPMDGRPRWMRDRDHAGEWQRPQHTVDRDAIQAGFKDDEDGGQGANGKGRQRPSPRHTPPSQPQSQSRPLSPPEREQEIHLFDADSPITVYQSPFRRGKSKTQTPPTMQPSSSTASSSTQTPLSTSRSSLQTPRTLTTTISLSALTTSMSHKSAGTDAYKRGDFPTALTAYTRALSALPPEHVLRVPILTNVALVRSKVGELKDAIKACEEAIAITRMFVGGAVGDGRGKGGAEMSFMNGSDFDEKAPVRVGAGKVSVLVQGDSDSSASRNGDLPTSVDLVEGLSKGFKRRAEALEGLEKWEMARSTWEVLAGAEWAGASVKGEAVKGMGRCRRMVGGSAAGGIGPSSQSTPLQARPRPQPKPISNSISPSAPSAALTALRSTHNAQQTEDATRLACKDAVDARLIAWKSGREGNIRTLLTSLDESVLWPELGWRKVGLSEVVSKGQVKMAYVKAIAKVHPDKLHAGNTTVEQRMIANGVFGTLNDAWNVFQQQ